MAGLPLINTSLDFRIHSAGRDPAKCSLTLRRYRWLLWSKPLPGGDPFALLDDFAGYVDFFQRGYLVDSDHAVRFFLRLVDVAFSARPTDLVSNTQFRTATTEFLHLHDLLIEQWSSERLR